MKKNLPVSQGNSSLVAKAHKKLFVVAFTLLISFSGFAHTVDGYTSACNSGPIYTIDANVSNVNSSSNYAWQYKNTSGVWVCIVNGNNTINGNVYSISGATSSLTTNPAPIVFNNPGIALNGLVIRCVISDGSGVNPCNMPSGNTWNSNSSSVNFTINVSNTPCGVVCNAHISSLYFNKLDGGTDLPITNGAVFTVAQLGSLYDLEVATTGTVGSVVIAVSGPTPSTVTENSAPYNSPGTGNGAWTGAAGNYSVNIKIYSGSGGTGSVCDTKTFTFILNNVTTFSLGNLVWHDTNGDGISNNGETGVGSVTVKLYNDANNDNVADGAAVATTTTNASGIYSFTGLAAGNYIVGVTIPNGFLSSNVNGGDPDNNTDNDDNGQVAAGTEVRGLAITLSAGAEPTGGNVNNTYDFGLINDCNCSGGNPNLLTNGSFENGSTGWSVSGGNITTGTTYAVCGTTNAFLNESSGTAKIWQDVAVPAGSVLTLKGYAGTHTAGISCSPKLSLVFLNSSNAVISQVDATVTRDVDGAISYLELYTINATAPVGTVKVRVQGSIGCNTLKLDALCLTKIQLASLGDFVWQDLNSNGLQDPGEPGIPNVTVVLKDASNTTVGTTTTNENGIYAFTNLPAGTYSVTFTTPTNYAPSPANAGSDENDASDSDPVGGVVNGIALVAGQNNITIDAGFIKLVNLSGNVWHDVNALDDNLVNNTGPLQTPPAATIPTGLRVYLVNASTGLIERIAFVSSATGTYSFPNITPNTNYFVYLSFVSVAIGNPPPPTLLPDGWEHTGQKLGITPGSDGINDGRLGVPVFTTDVINANFGIRVKSGEVIIG